MIERLGNKSTAKKTMEEAGVPVIPGNSASVYTVEEGFEHLPRKQDIR